MPPTAASAPSSCAPSNWGRHCPQTARNRSAAARKDEVIRALAEAVRTGAIGDGKIFVSEVAEAIRIRDDTRGESAL
jgi:hypothetical protein